MKRRIALSLFLLGCAFCAALGCVDTGAVADDQPADVAPDAAVTGAIPDCPACDPWPDPPPEKLGADAGIGASGIGTSP